MLCHGIWGEVFGSNLGHNKRALDMGKNGLCIILGFIFEECY